MHVTVWNLVVALLWSAVAGVAVWFALYPIRRRSTAGLITSLVLVGAAASMGAVWGAVRQMIVPDISWTSMLAVTAFSVVVTALAAAAVSRRLAHDTASLRDAIADVGAGRVPGETDRRLTTELHQVRGELRDTAEALARTRAREQSLEAARRELVSWVSHDLRTPLAGLRAMSEALEDGVADDPQLYYKQMGLAVERLTTMVDDLFDLSRIQAARPSDDEHEPILVRDLVGDCVAALEPLAAARQIELTHAVEIADGDTVFGNAHDLDRALTNLVANAIRHTRTCGLVEVRASRDEPRSVRIVVRDQCGGIAPEHLARVFDVGFRGESARTPSTSEPVRGVDSGAGLGLAIARGIVESHAGTIGVTNHADGCAFRIVLPRVSGDGPQRRG